MEIPFLGLFRKKTPPPFPMKPRGSIRDVLPAKDDGGILPAVPGAIHHAPLVVPEGVDLSELWKEPEDPSSLITIASIASAVLSLVAVAILILR